MSTLTAKRKLHRHGQHGNWRFKGLLLAALDPDVSPEDVAKAWPNPGKPSDYRFLAQRPDYDVESAKADANREYVGETGEERHRLLSDHVASADNVPKHLSGDPTTDDDGTLRAPIDAAIPRMLFSGSTWDEVGTLFRDQLREVVADGAMQRRIARDAATVFNADTPRGDYPVAQDDQFARPVAQGAEIREDRENYDTVEWDTTKFGLGARITDELIDTANIDVIERQIEHVGRAVENSINREWLTTLVDDASNNHEASDGERGVPAINAAYGEVDGDDFIPDTFVTHPEYRTTLFDDSNIAFANRAGTDDVIRERVFDPLLSVEHFGASGVTYDDDDGTETWGFDANGEKGAVVYDRNQVVVVMYAPNGEDIEVKDYDDPIRDLQGVNARVHTDTIYLQERAAATVEHAA